MLANKNQKETDNLTSKCSRFLTNRLIGSYLNRGASINGTNSNSGKSILTIITEGYINGHNNLDMMHYLLDRGADPFLRDCKGDSMLSVAVAKGSVQLLKIIMERVDAKKDVFELFRLFEVHNLQDEIMIAILKQISSNEILNLLQSCKNEAADPLPKLEEYIEKFFKFFPENSTETQERCVGNINMRSSTKNQKSKSQSANDELFSFETQEQCVDHINMRSSTKNKKSKSRSANDELFSLCSRRTLSRAKLIGLIKEGANVNSVFINSTRSSVNDGQNPLTKLVGHYLRSSSESFKVRTLSCMRTIIKCGGNPYKIDTRGNSAISLAHKNGDENLQELLIEMYHKPETRVSISRVDQMCKMYQKPETNISVNSIEQPSTSHGR